MEIFDIYLLFRKLNSNFPVFLFLTLTPFFLPGTASRNGLESSGNDLRIQRVEIRERADGRCEWNEAGWNDRQGIHSGRLFF